MEKQLQEDLELILGDELGQLRDKRRSERLESVLESVQALESESSELRTEIDIAGARVHKSFVDAPLVFSYPAVAPFHVGHGTFARAESAEHLLLFELLVSERLVVAQPGGGL